MDFMHSATITISEKTRRELLKAAGELQQKRGEKVDYDDVMEYLLRRTGKDEELLRAAVVPTGCSSAETRKALSEGRAEEEKRSLSVALPEGRLRSTPVSSSNSWRRLPMARLPSRQSQSNARSRM